MCTKEATTIHHKKGRGIYLLDKSTWIGLCMGCHRWVTDNPKEALEKGLIISRINK